MSGARISSCTRRPSISVSYTHLINTSPETAFNASGPALGQADIDALCAFLRRLNPDDQLVVSGNLQKSPPCAFSALLSAAQEAGVSAVVDTSGAALREALAFRPLLIKPNGEEPVSYTHLSLASASSRNSAVPLPGTQKPVEKSYSVSDTPSQYKYR